MYEGVTKINSTEESTKTIHRQGDKKKKKEKVLKL